MLVSGASCLVLLAWLGTVLVVATLAGVAEETAAAWLSLGVFASEISVSCGRGSRIMPSRFALRRTRSAWASAMLDEWLFTSPICKASVRASVSLLESPNSFASS